MCGGSGASGTGFALVKSTSNSLNAAKGALIVNEAFTEGLLSGANPPCPTTVLGWAPTEGEGSIVEGDTMLELTSGCGSSKALSRGLSLWGIGLVLNEAALPGKNTADARIKFAAAKYDALNSTIALATIQATFRSTLSACMTSSRTLFDKKKYAQRGDSAGELRCIGGGKRSCVLRQCQQPESQRGDSRTFRESASHDQSRILGNPAPGAWPPL